MEEQVIAVGAGASARGRAAADWAAGEALRRGVPLHVVRVAPEGGASAEVEAELSASELANRYPALTVRRDTPPGAVVPALRALGARAGLTVLGTGRTASAVAGASAGPVVLVPERAFRSDGSDAVTVGVTAGDPPGAAIGFAFEEARLHGVRLHALSAWALPAEAAASPLPVPEVDRATWEDEQVQVLSDALRPWRRAYPDVEVLADVVLLPPADALVHAADGSGLLVLGRRGAADLPGLTTRLVLREARCPVAVVPGPGPRTMTEGHSARAPRAADTACSA
ncbi:universal stress protein [Streptomyces sp. MUM 2J]|uniref:universal stress protein n=1 Tax=Streptomyces sp. MUM 2J TaxID=2791987 RepID=UPI001F04B307|nr:universal stress protein [Streptomyces sp. MUM 2J]MCH0565783.1 universal stress protein [Streptomyces sp. MUM 2J]